MRLLLDTHVLIWWDAGAALSEKAMNAIREAEQVYVSAVTGWEIAIKESLGRLETTRSVSDAMTQSGFEELPLRIVHARSVANLPWHHRDPFDRMLVAQAREEALTLVSRDKVLLQYDVRLLEA